MPRACGQRAKVALLKRPMYVSIKETYICEKKLLNRHIQQNLIARREGPGEKDPERGPQ